MFSASSSDSVRLLHIMRESGAEIQLSFLFFFADLMRQDEKLYVRRRRLEEGAKEVSSGDICGLGPEGK